MSTSMNKPSWIALVHVHSEAIQSSLRQFSLAPWSAWFTFLVIGITLALPMSLYVLLSNIRMTSLDPQATNQITLYLKKNTPSGTITALLDTLQRDSNIDHVQYISPEEGFSILEKQFAIGTALMEFKENPLPPVIVLHPQKHLKTTEQIERFMAQIKNSAIEEVQFDAVWAQRLRAIMTFGHWIIGFFMALLALSTFLIIGNTIRLMTQNRREEIMIIKLLGAKDHFVRRPFLYSGIFFGLMGGIIAWLLIEIILFLLQQPAQNLAAAYGNTFALKKLPGLSMVLLVISSCALGYCSSWWTVSHYIKRINPE